jgi:hypothetical protein
VRNFWEGEETPTPLHYEPRCTGLSLSLAIVKASVNHGVASYFWSLVCAQRWLDRQE